MKLFVAYHYDENNKWIRDLVIPLIQTLDINVITGEDVHGRIIIEEVKSRIKKCDCFVSFITKSWAENPWVRDELITANALKIPALEVRDSTILGLNGIVDGIQRLDFDTNKKEDLLLKLAQILSNWQKMCETRSLKLLPNEILHEARPHIRGNSELKCLYQFKDGNEQSEEYETELFKLPDSLGVDIKNIPSQNAMVQLTIKGPGFVWSCGYQSFGLIPINLIKEA